MTTVVLSAPPILQFFNNLGQPNSGGSILTQVGGSNYATYQDSGGTTPLPNPIPLNSRGEVSNAVGATCQLFLVAGVTYTFTLYDANGNQLNQATYVAGVGAVTSVNGAIGAVTVAAAGANNDITSLGALTSVPNIITAMQQQSIAASVASNALTVNFNGGPLAFRNATLTSGTPVELQVGALNLVAPSGATLGTINATQAQLALVVLYNGGTPALGIVNMAGGVNLDETTLLSTTAISAAATANNVVYSNSAITNSPFRVVGYINITEATAGTWATQHTLAQGAGGQALPANSLGVNQTWQDVTVSRAGGTTYYNTTNRSMAVAIQLANSGSSGAFGGVLTVNGLSVSNMYGIQQTGAGNYFLTLFGIVPPGGSYATTGLTAITIPKWLELR